MCGLPTVVLRGKSITAHNIGFMKCPLLIVLLYSTLFSFGQKAELKGIFLDSLLHERPVRISLLKDSTIVSETLAANQGNYSFKNLDAGIYTLHFKRIGEREIIRDSIVLKSGETIEVNVNSMECPFRYPKGYKPVCPRNPADKIIPIAYGFPSSKTMKKAREGKVYLGGCVVTDCDPRYYCPAHKLEF